MASRLFRKMVTLNQGEARITGQFRPNGSGALVANTASSGLSYGTGYTVARTSLGLYTVTFADQYPKLIAAHATVRDHAGMGFRARVGDYSATNKTLKIYTSVGAPRFFPLDLLSGRILSGNDFQNTAATGGLPTKNTAPILERINAATDIATRLAWAATVVAEYQFPPIPLPPEAVASGNAISVNLLISKDTNTDNAAVVAVKGFMGIGGSNLGGNTAALATASITKYSVSLTPATAYPSMLNVALVPGTHANDAIRLHAAWLEVDTLADLTSNADSVVQFEAVFGNLSFS